MFNPYGVTEITSNRGNLNSLVVEPTSLKPDTLQESKYINLKIFIVTIKLLVYLLLFRLKQLKMSILEIMKHTKESLLFNTKYLFNFFMLLKGSNGADENTLCTYPFAYDSSRFFLMIRCKLY